MKNKNSGNYEILTYGGLSNLIKSVTLEFSEQELRKLNNQITKVLPKSKV